jgi:hypothetical protein
MNEFEKYRRNITSQYGEDGIIEELFKRLGVSEPVCIEFGAWDGKYLSNVWNLWTNHNWSALLIEGEVDRAEALARSVTDNKRVKVVQTFVTSEGEQSLDAIAKRNGLPRNVDLVSIDIDGNDYYILKSLEYLQPRVIIVEYNPTIPPEVSIVQKEDEFFGASAKALLELAHTKQYKLVAITDTNLFLVDEKEFAKLGMAELNLAQNFPGTHLTYLYSSYDGRLFVDKKPPYLYQIQGLKSFMEHHTGLRPLARNLLKKKQPLVSKKHPSIESEPTAIPVYIFKE